MITKYIQNDLFVIVEKEERGGKWMLPRIGNR